MESTNLEAKYQKLATEYSKLRAQASVLKKAVIEEQGKNSNLRDVLRQKESAIRRTEQEVDSLGFRNKQLEHRVASLQDDFAKESKKSNKSQKVKLKSNQQNSSDPSSSANSASETDYLIFEELQKKIMENAQLTSLIDDRDREVEIHAERIKELEKQVAKRTTESTELERRLRKELDTLSCRNSELETKLVEVASMLGSEDALSVSGSDHTPLHMTANSSTSEDRIIFLEKEVLHWRTQYEISKINDNLPLESNSRAPKDVKLTNGPALNSSCCSTAATGVIVSPSDSKTQSDATSDKSTKEQIIFNSFSKKFEDLLKAKCMSESRLSSYISECEHLQHCLEEATEDLKQKDRDLLDVERSVQNLEEDLATTRINYEEQISVLTEQVISLSEQLAECK